MKFVLKYKFFIILIVLSFTFIFFDVNKKEDYYRKNNNPNIFDKVNKIIIIGDSRMELINYERKNLKIPKNIIFIAKSGTKIDWLYSEALSEFYKTINKEDKFKVIFNLGVNDLNSNDDVVTLAKQYLKIYKKITNYDNIKFYFLSVNPINESVIDEYFKGSKITNEKIVLFNKTIKNSLKNKNNFKY